MTPAEADGFPEPLTELREAAVQLHELFLSYLGAGFSQQQALYLIGKVLEISSDHRPEP